MGLGRAAAGRRYGGSIRFTSIDRGQPHTVTFGTIIGDAVNMEGTVKVGQ